MKAEIDAKNFREDLYHRLSVILIHVPTLNDRKEDIPLLTEHFNEMICGEYGQPKKEFTKDAVVALQNVDWTGNIREFRNVVERLLILCDKKITGEDVKMYVSPISK
jgi:two-component system, NtrC family, nitrogen regulation response regulator NtrX